MSARVIAAPATYPSKANDTARHGALGVGQRRSHPLRGHTTSAAGAGATTRSGDRRPTRPPGRRTRLAGTSSSRHRGHELVLTASAPARRDRAMATWRRSSCRRGRGDAQTVVPDRRCARVKVVTLGNGQVAVKGADERRSARRRGRPVSHRHGSVGATYPSRSARRVLPHLHSIGLNTGPPSVACHAVAFEGLRSGWSSSRRRSSTGSRYNSITHFRRMLPRSGVAVARRSAGSRHVYAGAIGAGLHVGSQRSVVRVSPAHRRGEGDDETGRSSYAPREGVRHRRRGG